VPALRERRDEVPTLTDFFVARYSRKYNRPLKPISEPLRELFLQYEWPGNIRELENMIKRVVILQDEHLVVREIQASMQRRAAPAPVHALAAVAAAAAIPVGAGVGGVLPGSFPVAPEPDVSPEDDHHSADAEDESGGSLAAVAKAAALKAERAAIEQTLTQVHWNRRKAAQILGVSYKTLLNKIKECRISRD
jgi:DNA-binding NtrC family response regulator